MSNLEPLKIDFVRELRLRQWARQHFVPTESRKASWHPVVLDEMSLRDRELLNESQHTIIDTEIAQPARPHVNFAPDDAFRVGPQQPGSRFVPLEPTLNFDIHLSSIASSEFEQVIPTIDSAPSTQSSHLAGAI